MRKQFPISRKVILLLGDVFLLVNCLFFAVVIKQLTDSQPQLAFNSYIELSASIALFGGLLLIVNGLVSLLKMSFYQLILSIGVTVFQLLIIMMAAGFFFREFSYPRTVLFGTAVLQFVSLVGWNYLFWRIENSLIVAGKVLVIGNDESCLRVICRLQNYEHLNYDIHYLKLDDHGVIWEKLLEDVQRVVISPDLKWSQKAEVVNAAHLFGRQVVSLPDLYDVLNFQAEFDKIDDVPVFRAKFLRPTLEQRILKRILDILVAGFTLVVFFPVLLSIAVLVKITSPGSILYTQKRVGRDEQVFTIFKFRTMQQNAEKNTGPVMASENDQRITAFGMFLRMTRLDELPQLINVVKGDMSIVGPRPERPVFVEQFKNGIPGYGYRHNVKPGITGMAQVHGRYNTAVQDKLVYDLIYIQKCSIFTDVVIMLQTIKVLVTKESTAGVGLEAHPVNIDSVIGVNRINPASFRE